MLSPDTDRKRATASKTKNLILLVFVSALAGLVGVRFPVSMQGSDFPDFYCASRMLADGHGHELYDAELQHQYQARYAGRVGTLYIHPPFEAVLYLAVAWVPLKQAYLLWSLLNLAFLTVAARVLAKEALLPWDWRILLAASLTFVPVLLCLQQGQDSLVLLLLVVLAYTALRRDRAFAAGCWLGLGLFKFQLVVPLFLVLVVTQSRSVRSGLAKGFIVVALALAGMSAAISGWRIFTVYPDFLVHLQAQPFAGIVPQAMANFRGLAYFFFRSNHSSWAVATVAILSAAALITTLTIWKQTRLAVPRSPAANSEDPFDLPFAGTVVFALLVSYHLNPHDLSLLLLPVALVMHRTMARRERPGPANWITLTLVAILFLPPLHLWALQKGFYALLSLPLFALWLISAFIARQNRTA